jgi:hypothetical protein
VALDFEGEKPEFAGANEDFSPLKAAADGLQVAAKCLKYSGAGPKGS